MVIKTIRASKKYIHKLDHKDTAAFAVYNPKTGEHQILIPFRATTKCRCHEIAHCVLLHCLDMPKWELVSEYITKEIDAEIWAYEKCGKTVSVESLLNIAANAIERGVHANFTFNIILDHMKTKRLVLDRQAKSYLWHEIKIAYQEYRKGE